MGIHTTAGRPSPSNGMDLMTRETKYSEIRRALDMGLSDQKAAVYAGVCDATVLKYRQRHNIPNFYERARS